MLQAWLYLVVQCISPLGSTSSGWASFLSKAFLPWQPLKTPSQALTSPKVQQFLKDVFHFFLSL